MPDQEPVGGVVVALRISLREPEGRLRSIRQASPGIALSVAVPVSSSEPAMRRAVPERVTSVSDALPCKAESDCCNNCEAWVLEEAAF